jgi:hypothetical protein
MHVPDVQEGYIRLVEHSTIALVLQESDIVISSDIGTIRTSDTYAIFGLITASRKKGVFEIDYIPN